MARLNVGTGSWVDPDPEVINLDIHPYPGVQCVWDLDQHPWPFDDDVFTEVRAVQVFEHVHDPVGFMTESHRVLEPGGLLLIVVPHWQSENSHTDPTHVRHCTERTWDYWCHGTQLHAQFGPAYAGDRTFDRESVERQGDDIYAYLRKR